MQSSGASTGYWASCWTRCGTPTSPTRCSPSWPGATPRLAAAARPAAAPDTDHELSDRPPDRLQVRHAGHPVPERGPPPPARDPTPAPVSYTHLRAHETVLDLVCRLLLEKKKHKTTNIL